MGRQKITPIGDKSQKQLQDYLLLKETLAGNPKGWVYRVQGFLREYQVYYSYQVIHSRGRALVKGSAVFNPSSDMKGVPGARDGKDRYYAGFWTAVDFTIPNPADRYYIGLPDKQLDMVCSKMGSNKVVACEMDIERYRELEKFTAFLRTSKPHLIISVQNRDIFEVLKGNRNSFNIFDLDLMVHLPRKRETLDEWAKTIYEAAKPGRNVLGLVCSIGRKGTERDYQESVDYL